MAEIVRILSVKSMITQEEAENQRRKWRRTNRMAVVWMCVRLKKPALRKHRGIWQCYYPYARICSDHPVEWRVISGQGVTMLDAYNDAYYKSTFEPA